MIIIIENLFSEAKFIISVAVSYQNLEYRNITHASGITITNTCLARSINKKQGMKDIAIPKMTQKVATVST